MLFPISKTTTKHNLRDVCGWHSGRYETCNRVLYIPLNVAPCLFDLKFFTMSSQPRLHCLMTQEKIPILRSQKECAEINSWAGWVNMSKTRVALDTRTSGSVQGKR